MRGCVNVCGVQSVCDGFDAGRCMVSVGVALGVVGRWVASGACVVLSICVCRTHMCGAAHTEHAVADTDRAISLAALG